MKGEIPSELIIWSKFIFYPRDFVFNQNCLPIMKSRIADTNGSFDLRWVVNLQSLNGRSDVSRVVRSTVGKMIKIDLVDESLVSFRVEDLGVLEDLDAIVLLFQRAFIGQRASSASKQLVQLRWGVQVVAPGKTKSFAEGTHFTYVVIGQCGFMNLLSINPLRTPTKLYWFIWMSIVLPVGWQSPCNPFLPYYIICIF